MIDKKRTLILEGNLFKALLFIALPIMLNNLIQSFYNLGDAYWVSRIGDIEIAAVNFVWPVTFLTISFAMGISIGGASIISQYIGANKLKDASETAQQLYIFATFFGIISCILGIIFTPTVIHLMGATGDLYIASIKYLRIMFIQVPFLFMLNIFLSINQAQGDTITPTLLNASSAILNMIFDPIFIFVFHLGIIGAAIATVLATVPFSVYGIYRLSRGLNFIKIKPLNFHINYPKMKELLTIGIPSSFGSSGVALGFIILFGFVVKYGDYAVAALGIGNRINSLAFMPAIGVGAALTTVTGQNLGAGNPKRVAKAYKISIAMALSFLIVTSSLLWIFSEDIVRTFSDTKEVVNYGSFYLKALASTTWTISFFNCTLGLLNGSGHTLYAMFLDSSRLWLIRIPMIVTLGAYSTFGVKSIWYGISWSNAIAGVLAIIVALTGVWKKPKIKNLNIIKD